MDVCRGVTAAYRRHAEDVVEVTVGEQDRSGPQPQLTQDLGEGVGHPDARVDHDALLPFRGGEHEAVGVEGGSGEANGEHGQQSLVHADGVP